MVIERLLAEVDPAGGVSAPLGAETGAGAASIGRAARAGAELEAALGLRMVSISAASAPALLSRIIAAVERSNLVAFDDFTWLIITEQGTCACSISSTPWLVSTESAGGGAAALSGAAVSGVAVAGGDAPWTGAGGVWPTCVTGTGAGAVFRCFHHQPAPAAAATSKTPAAASARGLSGFF